MTYNVIAATGQLSWTVVGAPANTPLQEGFPIATLEWDFVAAGSFFRVLVRDRVTENTLVTFSNDPDASDKNNTCNGQSTIANILAEIKNAFNVSGGGGGGGDATAANQVIANQISEQILLEVGEGPEHVLTSEVATSAGNVPSGRSAVSFILSSNFYGAINGIFYSGNNISVISFSSQEKRVLPQIDYVIEAGSAIINSII